MPKSGLNTGHGIFPKNKGLILPNLFLVLINLIILLRVVPDCNETLQGKHGWRGTKTQCMPYTCIESKRGSDYKKMLQKNAKNMFGNKIL